MSRIDVMKFNEVLERYFLTWQQFDIVYSFQQLQFSYFNLYFYIIP